MDDNNRGLSPEEIDAIIEKYDNGEISESELIKAIENASTDTNFTDDFSDNFFTDKVNIDPNTIREESVYRQSDGVLDDDADNPFNEKREFDESETSAGSGHGLSKKRDIQKSDNEKNKKPVKKTTKKIRKVSPAFPTSIEESHADTPEDKDNLISRNVSQSQSVPLRDNDEENDINETIEEEEDTYDEEVEKKDTYDEEVEKKDTYDEEDAYGEEKVDDEEETDDPSIGPPSSQTDKSRPSPFNSPVFLNNDEKKRITPGKKGSRKKSSPFDKSKNDSENKNNKPSISPFGDPSGIGDNAKNANLSKKKAPNIWAQRFAAITASSQGEYEEETSEDFEGTSSQKHQDKDQRTDVPQNKKKSKVLLVLALLLSVMMIFPMIMMISGTMNNQILGANGGVCSDGVSTDDINKKGVRGVPEGETSNPEIMPPGRLTSGFGPRWGTMHRGQDLATGGDKVGIYAYYDGVVSVVKDNPGGFGYYVIVDHQNKDGEPFTSLYGHMFPDDILVKEGDTVEAGQLLAYEGYNGGVDPPGPGGQHLHFEIAPGSSGGSHFYNQVDPAPYLEDSINPNPDGTGGISGGNSDDEENTENAENAENASRNISFGLPKAHADETSSSPTTTSKENDEEGEDPDDETSSSSTTTSKENDEEEKDLPLGSNEDVCCSGGESKKNKNGTYNSNGEGNSADINEEMEKNADTIAAVLDEIGMGGDKEALRIAYIGGLGESGLQNKANDGRQASQLGSNQPNLTQAQIAETLNYPHVGEDSPLAVTGIYQQTIEWWGTVEDLMNPAYQAAQFITEMKKKNPNYKNENFFKVITKTQVQEIWKEGLAPEAHETYHVYERHLATADKLVEKYLDNHRDLTSEEKKLAEKGKKNRAGEGEDGGDSSSSGSSSSSKNKNNANSKCEVSDSKQSGSLPKDAKERVEKVIEEGRRIRAKNLPYGYGANDPNSSMDCSAFISYIWNKATGIKIGRSTVAMKANLDKIGGLEVDKDDVQPGDLMLWSGHVAMVTENNERMEAGNPVGSESPMSEENIGQEFLGYYRVSSLPEEMEKKGITYDDLEVSNIKG